MDNAFLARKTGGGSAYNYDLTPLIENFTFYDFVTIAKKEQLEDHGGFLVITNNQYIIGYNAGFGSGTHQSAFARTIVDINNYSKREITSVQDAITLYRKCALNYITARIIYEQNKGYITFDLNNFGGKITREQFETFKDFYNDYNEDIKWITKRNDFAVIFHYTDKFGKKQRIETDNLDALYNYFEQNIDYNKVIEEEQIIIGKERKNRKK